MSEKDITQALITTQAIFNKDSAINAIWKSTLGAKEKLVLLAVVHLADERGVCSATQQLIATRCGYGEKTAAARALRKLIADGYLKSQAGQKNGYEGHEPNRYIVNIEVAA